MARRKIITIDEKKCTGCGVCIPNCPEGALQIIDEKARLVSDLFCDGLGACIGHCPEGAISIEEREAGVYNEKKVMENIVKQGANVIKAHLEHLRDHREHGYLKEAISFLKERHIDVPIEEQPHGKEALPCGCPGTKVMEFKEELPHGAPKGASARSASQLRQWPIQIKLVPPFAPYLKNAHIVVAADCAPFSYANFHEDFLKGKALLVGCPKLDDAALYTEKIAGMLKENTIRSVTCVHMEVPCCFGFMHILKEAIARSGKDLPLKEVTISVKGERVS
jgi:ferredoxin